MMQLTPNPGKSHIEATGYDPSKQELHIQFRGGVVYTYEKVPADVANKMERAESKGSFYMRNIRDVYRHHVGREE